MKLRIRRRSRSGWLLWLLVVLPFFQAWLPGGTSYLLDGAWCILAVFLLRLRHALDWGKLRWLPAWVLGYLLLTAGVYLVRYQSALYYLWGLRNNFRFYAAFFAFALFLTPEDVADCWRILDRLFWVDILLSLVQFYGFGWKGDYLGGLFGTQQGCNGYTNVFFAVTVTKSVVCFLERRERWYSCAARCAAALYVAALAELKFFFVEFGVIVLLAVVFSDFSWRKVGLLLAGFAGLAVFSALLYRLFPEFEDWFSMEEMLRTAAAAEGYSSAGDLNRLTAVSGINRRFFQSMRGRLFGLGLGNCDHSGFELLTTPFYRRYSFLHYSWMSASFVYLETGYLGLAFFFGFFGLVYRYGRRRERRQGGSTDCRVGCIMAVLCMFIGIYNASLRTEAGYLAYFTLALPFAADGRKV